MQVFMDKYLVLSATASYLITDCSTLRV